MLSEKHDECLSFISEILGVLKSTHQPEQVFHLVVDRVVRSFHCQTCAVVLVDPTTEYLNIALAHGISHTFTKAFRRHLAAGAIGRLLWTGAPIIVEDDSVDPSLAADVMLENPFGSAVCVPMAVQHTTIGYLHVDRVEKSTFTRDEIRILQCFADLAALALYSSRLFEENIRLDRIDHETELEKYAPFLERIGTWLDRSKTIGESFSVTILDVDNFKHIAATHGYESSKRLLRGIADLIKSQLRGVDAVGRHGYDEFIVMRANAGWAEGTQFADALRESIGRTTFTESGIRTTVSVGVSVCPRHAADVQGILLAARTALFEAQRKGRNKVVLFGSEVPVEEAGALHD